MWFGRLDWAKMDSGGVRSRVRVDIGLFGVGSSGEDIDLFSFASQCRMTRGEERNTFESTSSWASVSHAK